MEKDTIGEPFKESICIWVLTSFKEQQKTVFFRCFSCFGMKNHRELSEIYKKKLIMAKKLF